MTDSQLQEKHPCEEWMKLATIPKEQLIHFSRLGLRRDYTMKPSYYVDINGKEWIIMLMPDPDNSKTRLIEHSSIFDDAYLYDVENDKLVEFIHSYETDIHKRFKISFPYAFNDSMKKKDLYRSYVIDNDNHVMYWYICGYAIDQIGDFQMHQLSSFIIAFSIKDLQNIEFMYQQSLSDSYNDNNDDDDEFSCAVPAILDATRYQMVMVDNRIEMILGNGN